LGRRGHGPPPVPSVPGGLACRKKHAMGVRRHSAAGRNKCVTSAGVAEYPSPTSARVAERKRGRVGSWGTDRAKKEPHPGPPRKRGGRKQALPPQYRRGHRARIPRRPLAEFDRLEELVDMAVERV